MLSKVKKALRVMTTDFDDEITSLINACITDLGISGVEGATISADSTDDIVIQAVISYCKWRFGQGNSEWREIYEIQKAQLGTATNYTEW